MTDKQSGGAGITANDWGLLLLRLTMGGIMLLHGIPKLMNGIDGIKGMVVEKGMPEFVAYGVHVGETLAPLLIIFGLFTRPAALVFSINMLIAGLLAHSDNLFAMGERGGLQNETLWLYLLGGLALVFTGSGKIGVRQGKGPLD